MISLERVVVASPAGNLTAIVFDDLGAADLRELNEALLAWWSDEHPEQPPLEQCCVVRRPTDERAIARVEMFGGEFCGNATRSVIHLVTANRTTDGYVESSSVDGLLPFEVRDGVVTLTMPIGANGARVTDGARGALVAFDGIAHLVVDVEHQAGKVGVSPRELMNTIVASNEFGAATWPAFGVTTYNRASGRAAFCVRVRDLGTVFDETACGSGTCAIAITEARRCRETVSADVVQPSGKIIHVQADYDVMRSDVTQVTIAGPIDVLFDGPLHG